jgi:hypothetical protein
MIIQIVGGAIYYPLIGLLVVAAGWSVGEVLRRQPTSTSEGFIKYAHLLVLGFFVDAIAKSYWSGSFWGD